MAHPNEEDFTAEIRCGGGYGSEFDEQETKSSERNKTRRDDVLSGVKRKCNSTVALPSKCMLSSEYSREEAKNQKHEFVALDAYSRHKKMINDYVLYYGKGIEHFRRDSFRDRSDLDIIKQEHRFLWSKEDNPESMWEKSLAKKYYDKLFKEYCISDLSRYKENKVALRWRIEKEVVEGKGHFVCGDKRCAQTEGLCSWEVNFAYVEHGEKKNTLIKLRLCPDCSYKLNYHHQKKLAEPKWKGKDAKEKSRSSKKKQKEQTYEKHDGSSASQFKGQASVFASLGAVQTKNPTREGEDMWKGPVKDTVDKTREEEFEEYFQDLFL
ncbi:protein FRA10AC1-like isoform X1 [Montipora capricornis]|uniref:protein FRA10AC1-like isoform X1 n=1 Tax=Montipora capricornis TaxID=246305 RepID=UPI0035F1E023